MTILLAWFSFFSCATSAPPPSPSPVLSIEHAALEPFGSPEAVLIDAAEMQHLSNSRRSHALTRTEFADAVVANQDKLRFVPALLSDIGISLTTFDDGSVFGSFEIAFPSELNATKRREFLDLASQHGLVLLQIGPAYNPDSLGVYLGSTPENIPNTLHTRAGKLQLIESGPLLNQVSRLIVLGKTPNHALRGIARQREPDAVVDLTSPRCESQGVTIVSSPREPVPGQPLRLITVHDRDPGPAAVLVKDPFGNQVPASLRQIPGPPYAMVTTVYSVPEGEWTFRLGDGTRSITCAKFSVSGDGTPSPATPLTSREWTEIYAVFVATLFDIQKTSYSEPHDLLALLRDPTRNLFYNHFGNNEEQSLALHPKGPNLSLLLESYFAWKMKRPFGYRHCGRGGVQKPPRCGPLTIFPQEDDDVLSYMEFTRRASAAVHTATARTHPDDNETSYYPVALTRDSLLPGTVFADHHGHSMVLVRWLPQRMNRLGAMMLATARPGAGLKTFWRGRAVFSPDTQAGGAGFKQARPLRQEHDRVRSQNNTELTTHIPYNTAQYATDSEAFYASMEKLINPLTVDWVDVLSLRLTTLERLLHERLKAITSSEEYLRSNGPIAMPAGPAIFIGSGTWEDLSTPARDFRMLIAMRDVMGLGREMRAQQKHYGLKPQRLEATITQMEQARDTALDQRKLIYLRSDGSSWPLSYREVMQRRVKLQMGYNPNDCPELRWGAARGSREASTCKRRAPRAQKLIMLRYRHWFQSGVRPLPPNG